MALDDIDDDDDVGDAHAYDAYGDGGYVNE